SMEVDTGESANTLALGAAAFGTGETVIVGGLKFYQTLVEIADPNHLLLVASKVVEKQDLNRVMY
ncbi:hypothetical protein Tco_0932842, partial [Tanacetum coccineum]